MRSISIPAFKRQTLQKFLRLILWLTILAILANLCIYVINRCVYSQTEDRIKTSIQEIPTENPPPVAIVFGARVYNDNSVSPVVYDRVKTAVELYKAGKVKRILMSGDNPTAEYDEPTAMKNTAIELGVPASDVYLDFAGRRTYDTCYRAKEIFEVKKAILVTQAFHLPRALYLCNNLGVESIGLKANLQSYAGEGRWAFREFFSMASAWSEVNIYSFEPIKGQKEPIPQ